MENYPILKQEYLEINNNCYYHNKFEEYINWSINHVNTIQIKNFISNTNNNQISEIPLTFYPIAKNIRIPASHMTINITHNKSSFINNLARNGEQQFWQHNLQRGNWYPWLWTRGRILTKYSNYDGWNYYFNSFSKNHKIIFDNLQSTNIIEPPDNLKLFFIYLACIQYTFQLNDNYLNLMNEYKKKMNWPSNSKILAVQIRRGDSCTRSGDKTFREYFNIHKYIEKIELLLSKDNYDYIYISTDSKEEIDNIVSIKPNWKILYLPIDRTQFYRMEDDAQKINNGFYFSKDIEDYCRLNPDKIPFTVDSALADLFFISQSNAFISTITMSEFAKTAWFLQIANNKKLTPYINLNTNNIDLSKSLIEL